MPKFTFSSTFFHSKTTWTALMGVVTAVVGLATHKLGLPQFGFALFAALQTAFLRDTFQKAVELPVPTGDETDAPETPAAPVA